MLLEKDPFNIVITGVGGQGNLLASQIMGGMFMDMGLKVTIGETLGLSQRGGSVMSHVRASTERQLSPIIPEGLGHLILALEPSEALRVLATYGSPECVAVINTRSVAPIDVLSGLAEYPEVDELISAAALLTSELYTINASEIALEMGNPILANIALIGAMDGSGAYRPASGVFKNAIKRLLPPKVIADNMTAYERGKDAVLLIN